MTAHVLLVGSNLGLGEETGACEFAVCVEGENQRWGLRETLYRLHEFSNAAQARITELCLLQLRTEP